jgi:hexokinase
LRVATVVFRRGGQAEIGDFSKYSMPGLAREYSAKEFYAELADRILPVASRSRNIGFCFSYPAEISPDCDGKLLYWTKEVKAPEVEGQYIGRNLLAALAERGHADKKVVILNDTIATLLAGKGAGAVRHCASYVGFILGTGTNTAYVERNAAITKRTDLDPGGSQAINIESGNFALAPRGDVDLAFDATTANPGRQALEKMISGAYLGGLALLAARTAAGEGLLGAGAAGLLSSLPSLSTIDMDRFAANPFCAGPLAGPALSDADRAVVLGIFSGVVARAAFLTAINISAAVLKSGAGADPLHPVGVNIDGSTFYKTYQFQSRVEEHLRRLLGCRGVGFSLTRVDEAPVIGAAVAALMKA